MSHAIAPPDPHKGQRFRLVNRCDGQKDQTPPRTWDYRIERCTHQKTGLPYWVVVITGADAATFANLKDSAKAAGGKYARAYRGNPGGLSFETEAAVVEWVGKVLAPCTTALAETVADLLHNDPDAQDRLVADLNKDDAPTVDLVMDLSEIRPWVVTLESEEYGREEFLYDSYIEAEQGYERVLKSARKQRDDVARTVSLAMRREVV